MSDAPLPQTVTPVMRDGPQMLLVQEQGIDSAKPTWMLPGGRVAYGEGPELALGREILEETGLTVIGEATLAFSVEIDSRLDDLVGRWRALTYACNADGTIEPADPEGLIRTAEWVEMDDALERLATVEWYDGDPLRSFLDGSAPTAARGAIASPAVAVRHSERLPNRSPRTC